MLFWKNKKNDKTQKSLIRTWDMNKFKEYFKNKKDSFQLCELCLLKDRNVYPKVFIKNGEIIDLPDNYKTFKIDIDGVVTTSWDIPCIHVRTTGGSDFLMACYIEGYMENGKEYWLKGGSLNVDYIKRVFERM